MGQYRRKKVLEIFVEYKIYEVFACGEKFQGFHQQEADEGAGEECECFIHRGSCWGRGRKVNGVGLILPAFGEPAMTHVQEGQENGVGDDDSHDMVVKEKILGRMPKAQVKLSFERVGFFGNMQHWREEDGVNEESFGFEP